MIVSQQVTRLEGIARLRRLENYKIIGAWWCAW